MISPDAVYTALSKDLEFTIQRTVTFQNETIPLEVKKASAIYLKDKFLTKLIPVDASEADLVACDTFLTANRRCEKWSLGELSSSDEQLVGEFLKIMEDFFLYDHGQDVDLNWSNIALNARCGPGASVGSISNTAYGKLYAGPLTATDPQLIALYRADISMWPEESNAENIRQENCGSPRVVKGSRSSFVPKTTKTSRMISVEPTLNMFYQLGLGEIITKRLKRHFGIDLSTQASVNRKLAYLGSVIDATWGDGFATIDLSSASDSLSLGLCSAAIPADWLDAMLGLRSHTTSIRVGGRDFDEKLHMMSTMGNGFTFPLQTAVFACAAAACVSLSDEIRSRPRGFSLNSVGMFSVFGDDIIVPSKVFERTCHLLRLLGFQPNPDKCFGSGSFRESCGHDYYRGYNIRPVFLRKLDTDADLMVLTNLLVDWSIRNEVPLSNAIELCIKNLKFVNIVPMHETEDAGLRVPFTLARDLSGLRLAKDAATQSFAYIKRVTHTRRMRVLDGTILVPPGVKRHIYNPSGLFMSFLRGEVRDGQISLRNWSPVYRTKRAIAPNWDYCPMSLEASLIGNALSPSVLARRYDEVLRPLLEGVVQLPRRSPKRARGRQR